MGIPPTPVNHHPVAFKFPDYEYGWYEKRLAITNLMKIVKVGGLSGNMPSPILPRYRTHQKISLKFFFPQIYALKTFSNLRIVTVFSHRKADRYRISQNSKKS